MQQFFEVLAQLLADGAIDAFPLILITFVLCLFGFFSGDPLDISLFVFSGVSLVCFIACFINVCFFHFFGIQAVFFF